MYLGVNIDHIATLREARRINEPDPIDSLQYLKEAGAHQVTFHLREDRRHICDSDARDIIKYSPLPVNVECSSEHSILKYICTLKPYSITLVPEKREEVTTEGGLELFKGEEKIKNCIAMIKDYGIVPSLFIDPTRANIEQSKGIGADKIELHTGKYANIFLMLYNNPKRMRHHIVEFKDYDTEKLKELLHQEISHIQTVAHYAQEESLYVAAGHGLNKDNLAHITHITSIKELNIGHSIISRAVFIGLQEAIREIIALYPH